MARRSAFHCDFLAIAAAEVGAIAERRTDRLLDSARSHGLPPFLVADAGVNSGLMIVQYTQAAMVAENRRLAAPASVDSIPTSAMQEDHVSMGWGAARKLRRAVGNLGRILAAELVCAARGLDLRAPLLPAAGTAAAVAALRDAGVPGPGPDRWQAPELAAAERLVMSGGLVDAVEAPSGRSPASARGSRHERGCWAARRARRTGHRAVVSQLADRGGLANADEQPRSRGRRGSRPSRRVRRYGSRRPVVGGLRRDLRRAASTLADDETMLVQSGKPVGVFRTNEWAPRVLLANSNLVPEWANWTEFRRLESLGLTMYGQMTAGSWIYIGTQGILQGTYECFAEIARRRFGGSLAGTITLTAGLGGMGGAQPLAITMNDGVALCVDVDADRVARRIEHRYLDEVAESLDDAVARCLAARDDRRALSVGVVGNAADACCRRSSSATFPPTSSPIRRAPTTRSRTCPPTSRRRPPHSSRAHEPDELVRRARQSMAAHCAAMVGYADKGAEVFDYGNSLRTEASARRFRAGVRLSRVPARLHPSAVL